MIFLQVFFAILAANLAVSATKAAFGGDTPLFKWTDSRLMQCVRRSGNGSTWRVVLNLQTPARRREIRLADEAWRKRMKEDYNMDFAPTH